MSYSRCQLGVMGSKKQTCGQKAEAPGGTGKETEEVLNLKWLSKKQAVCGDI